MSSLILWCFTIWGVEFSVLRWSLGCVNLRCLSCGCALSSLAGFCIVMELWFSWRDFHPLWLRSFKSARYTQILQLILNSSDPTRLYLWVFLDPLFLFHLLLLYLNSDLLAFRIQCLYLVVNQMPRRPSLREVNMNKLRDNSYVA